MRITLPLLLAFTASLQAQSAFTLREEMIPMRDGRRLSAYLYFPNGDGKWPAVFQQRYADITGTGTRKQAADLARFASALEAVPASTRLAMPCRIAAILNRL